MRIQVVVTCLVIYFSDYSNTPLSDFGKVKFEMSANSKSSWRKQQLTKSHKNNRCPDAD